MIEKFISIKNIGRFRDCTPRGDVTFLKLTLIFAENGRGKTTLCAIVRSLQTGRPEFISERKTLGTTEPASVHIRLGGENFAFSINAWSATHPDIAIFDSVFVHDNVYAGDYVDHEHKKNLYRVIVGAQGVNLARQIEELDDKIRDANTNIRTKKDAVSRVLPNGTSLEEYLTWQPVEDIESKIQQKKTEIAHRERTLEKATEIQSKGLLAKITLPAFPSDFVTILSKQLTDITADAEARVRDQINAHNMGRQGETWLSLGLGFVVDDKCPFCGQSINGNELIAAYRSHFNAAYKALKQEVAQLTQRISSAIGEYSLNAAQQAILSNLTLVEFWKQFTEIALPEFPIEDVRRKYATLRDLALNLAQQKQQSPTEPVIPGEDFQKALSTVESLQESVAAYNAAVETCNERINTQKSAAKQGSDALHTLKVELAELKAKKKRFEPEVIQVCNDYQRTVNEKADLEKQKAQVREKLDQYCQLILERYESSINTYLDQFNAGFRVVNTRHNYRGGTPSSQYQIQINGEAVDLGDPRTQPGTPCFKTTLSSGDRSALAFAFFLAALEHDPDIAKKIVVLDDPFTSQDRFRRTCTQQLIRQLAGKAMQVIVLSHDPYFLRLIWEGYPNDIKVLQILRAGDNTVIAEWDIEAETQSTYLKNYSTLLDFYRERKGNPLDVARSIRPFLEGLLRVHFPGHFQPNEWLGDFIAKIRNCRETDGLSHAKADLPELEAINDYSKNYHHDQNPNADSEALSEDELHGYVKRTLRLVGGY